jgi:F-type H+-transporting ATPase subunit a
LEKTSKWRWGVNRWFVLLFIILNIVAAKLFVPVQPHIQVAAELLSQTPLFTLPVIGAFYLSNTLTAMLLGDVIILLIAWAIRNTTSGGSLVPTGIAGAMEALVEVLYNLTESSAGKWTKKIFPWFATIMLIVLVANLVKLVPGFETIGFLEPVKTQGYPIQSIGGNWATQLPAAKGFQGGYQLVPFFRGVSTDLNFTLALALISVFMTQVIGFQTQKLSYLLKFANITNIFKKPFFGFMDLLVGLLELISEFAKILSFSFRLFGNMFAGMVLVALVGALVPIFVPSMIFMFEFFIGLIQAFVFGMLTMVFMSQATHGHGDEEHAD